MSREPKAKSNEPDLSFESLYTALEEKARKLEQGNLPLEESLQLYEEGAALVDRLKDVLDRAELRIRTVQRRFEEDELEPPDEDTGYPPED